MAETKEQQKQEPTPQEKGMQKIKGFMNSEQTMKRFQEIMGKKAPAFIMSVLQIIANNRDLAMADLQSVYNAAAMAAVLDLPLNNNLQFAHIVPYKNNKTGITYAQFQMGWRGFIQLGQRSGQFQTINITDVRQGELVSRDRLSGDCLFNWEQDDEKRATLPIIGYVSYFRLLNGFEKPLYRTVKELDAHGKKYSKSFNKEESMWNQDRPAMCRKTVIKELMSNYAPMSVESMLPISQAIKADQSVMLEEGKFDYPDNPIVDAEAEEIKDPAANAKKAADAAEELLKQTK